MREQTIVDTSAGGVAMHESCQLRHVVSPRALEPELWSPSMLQISASQPPLFASQSLILLCTLPLLNSTSALSSHHEIPPRRNHPLHHLLSVRPSFPLQHPTNTTPPQISNPPNSSTSNTSRANSSISPATTISGKPSASHTPSPSAAVAASKPHRTSTRVSPSSLQQRITYPMHLTRVYMTRMRPVRKASWNGIKRRSGRR